MNPTLQIKNVSLNLGRGDVDGGSQDSPLVSSLVSAVATALAGGEGIAGDGWFTWPLLCLRGDPTQSLTRRPNSSARALPSLLLPLSRGLICLI